MKTTLNVVSRGTLRMLRGDLRGDLHGGVIDENNVECNS